MARRMTVIHPKKPQGEDKPALPLDERTQEQVQKIYNRAMRKSGAARVRMLEALRVAGWSCSGGVVARISGARP